MKTEALNVLEHIGNVLDDFDEAIDNMKEQLLIIEDIAREVEDTRAYFESFLDYVEEL